MAQTVIFSSWLWAERKRDPMGALIITLEPTGRWNFQIVSLFIVRVWTRGPGGCSKIGPLFILEMLPGFRPGFEEEVDEEI